jgi:hypothetical protein
VNELLGFVFCAMQQVVSLLIMAVCELEFLAVARPEACPCQMLVVVFQGIVLYVLLYHLLRTWECENRTRCMRVLRERSREHVRKHNPSRREVKADGRINGVVKVTEDPKGPTGPDLETERVVNTQITNRIHVMISLDVTTGIAMAFSMHYKRPLFCDDAGVRSISVLYELLSR